MQLTSDDILGKEAVDPEGEILGVVMKLHLDSESKSILGITVDQGLWRPDLFIGIDYVKMFGVDAIFLNSIPPSKYAKIPVYSYDGVYLGKVLEVVSDRDQIQYWVLSMNSDSPKSFRKKLRFRIYPKQLAEKGYSFILKKGVSTTELELEI
jgi:sporulation protein YlmC with PRC-barrel domain